MELGWTFSRKFRFNLRVVQGLLGVKKKVLDKVCVCVSCPELDFSTVYGEFHALHVTFDKGVH